MIYITYDIEKYDTSRVKLIVTDGNFKTKVKSLDLGVELELRFKDNWKGFHKLIPVGTRILDKAWKNFSHEDYLKKYASSVGKVLYVRMNDMVIENGTIHANISRDLVEHELRHRWQKERNAFFGLRYLVSKKFRLKMEVDAYIYGWKDKIIPETKERYVEKITNMLTGGAYFASIKREMVEKEVRRQLELL